MNATPCRRADSNHGNVVRHFPRSTVAALGMALAVFVGRVEAQAPRVLPAGQLPADSRLGAQKDLNGYFPFAPSATPEEWAVRAERVRRQVLVSQGLWPLPSRTPPNAVIHGRIERGDYSVEKVFLESYPGHFVTGSLYRPLGRSGPFAGVLCPHGHWNNGRFHDWGPDEVKNQIVQGAERFEIAGRYPLQARCAQLARLGCVVFHYDMIGYADSVQIEHRPGVREAMNTPENWGFFSPQADLRLQSMMGVQTYNSIRALDWLLEQPDVDPARIGVTGASGGGTQTFILCAIDPRPAAAFPAVMVSTGMQGGCTCENADYLRVGTGNIELAALFAPKPLGMSAAEDWTNEIETKGLPELKQHYAMLGAPDNVMAKALLQFGHNYNFVSRTMMYHWFNKHLALGAAEPIVEQDFQPLTIPELSVWDDAHAKPVGGDDYERSLLRYMTEESNGQLAEIAPRSPEQLPKFREVVGGALDVLIGRGLPAAGAVAFERMTETDRGGYLEFTGLLRNAAAGEELPVVMFQPKQWNKQVVIWIEEQGKGGLYGADGALKPTVQKVLASGAAVVAADLLFQGEFTADGLSPAKASMVRTYNTPWGEFSGYTFGYNHPVYSQRVHDILSLVSFVRNHADAPEKVHLIGLDGAGPWVAAAAAQAGTAVDRLAVDSNGFRFAALTATDDINFLPGAVKYGDLPSILALAAAGRETWYTGRADEPVDQVLSLMQAAGGNVSFYSGEETEEDSAVAWLLR